MAPLTRCRRRLRSLLGHVDLRLVDNPRQIRLLRDARQIRRARLKDVPQAHALHDPVQREIGARREARQEHVHIVVLVLGARLRQIGENVLQTIRPQPLDHIAERFALLGQHQQNAEPLLDAVRQLQHVRIDRRHVGVAERPDLVHHLDVAERLAGLIVERLQARVLAIERDLPLALEVDGRDEQQLRLGQIAGRHHIAEASVRLVADVVVDRVVRLVDAVEIHQHMVRFVRVLQDALELPTDRTIAIGEQHLREGQLNGRCVESVCVFIG